MMVIARQQKPNQVADYAKRPRTDAGSSSKFGSVDRGVAEGQQRVERDIGGGRRPRNADDSQGHDDCGQKPSRRHP